MSSAHADPLLPPTSTVERNQAVGLEIITERTDATRVALRLRGEMDLANADLLTAVAANQLMLGRRFARVDLSELRFLDGAGLRVLVQAHNRFLAAHGRLILCGVGARCARLLAITHLDEVLLVDHYMAPDSVPPARVRHLGDSSRGQWP